jgi:hypothetical protein
VVGEHRQLLFAPLGCLVSTDMLDISSESVGISTFISFLAICSLSIVIFYNFSKLKSNLILELSGSKIPNI